MYIYMYVHIYTYISAYGLKLNKSKCELLIAGTQGPPIPIQFGDGTALTPRLEAKYLGCNLNNKAKASQEVGKRLAECMTVMNKLNIFWKRSNCPIKFKHMVFNVVLKSKLLYGLDSLELTQATVQRLDTFQLQGLRNMLRQLTTFGQMEAGDARTNTNKKIFEDMNRWCSIDTLDHQPIQALSEHYRHQKLSNFVKIMLLPPDDPRFTVTLASLTVRPWKKKSWSTQEK